MQTDSDESQRTLVFQLFLCSIDLNLCRFYDVENICIDLLFTFYLSPRTAMHVSLNVTEKLYIIDSSKFLY